ncbi:MAG: SycD/LcrH family type III secretion system chaperone [Rhodocyclaceae bacterium]|nr:SycD/LcrH family type III secretion system chaperone [Rhodocyclaceae bacterium]
MAPRPPTPAPLAEQITELLMNGGTLGAIYDYTEQDYEVLYALGHSLYAQGRYADAVKAFGFLVMHNHLEKRFVGAFASSLQMAGRHAEAVQYYTLASAMDMSDPAPTFHTAECLIALGRLDDAREALGFVVAQSGDAAHQPLRERAQALLALLDRQAQATS